MLCVEVWINGKRHCTAGAKELTRLFAHLTWHNAPSEARNNSPEFSVFGVTAREPQEHFFWLKESLEIGDEVDLKLIEAESFDEPDSEEPILHMRTLKNENADLGVEVGVNGLRLCTVGLEDSGFLFGQFAHHNLPERRKNSGPNPFIEVHGYQDNAPYNYLAWLEKGVGIGDEVSFKLVVGQELDEPEVKELLTPDTMNQPIIQQYVALIEGDKETGKAVE